MSAPNALPGLAPLRCPACGGEPPPAAWRCPRCGGPLELAAVPGSPWGPVRLEPPPGAGERWPWERSIWRWEPLLPAVPAEARVTLGEGESPLVPLAPLAAAPAAPPAGPEEAGIWLKLDFLQPTGSFKDRGAAFLVSYLRAQGAREVRDDSSGNAGVALAAYAARAGLRCHVYVPAESSEGKLAQLRLFGAEIHRQRGGRGAARRAAESGEAPGLYASHNWHPAFLAGLLSLGFELAEEVASLVEPGGRWHVVVPAGHGSLVLALGRSWEALERRAGPALAEGRLAARPAIWAVQADGDAPLVRALEAGLDAPSEAILAAPRGPTAAEGIAGARPVRGAEILRHLRRGGGAVTVTDGELAHALRRLLARGLLVEPTAAAALAGVLRLRHQGRIPEGEPVVAVLTGSGLKSASAVERLAGPAGGDAP